MLPRMRLLSCGLLLSLALVAAGQDASTPFQKVTVWKPVFQGIDLIELKADKPRPMHGFALRIDLNAPGLEFLATPGNQDKAGETSGLKTSTFLVKHKLQAAINATQFDPVTKKEGKAQDIIGLHVSHGRVVSPAEKAYPALFVTRNNKAWVADPPFDLGDVHNAVAGFQLVLKEGKVLEGAAAVHPRTGVGISADGRTMTWLVIDGRQKAYSVGATTAEVGQWLQALGARDGINLDGGGSTALVLGDAAGKPLVVNRPIDGGKPGRERVNASHIGLKALPLP